jgi:iron complex transport system ATP-binding protein
MVALSFRDVSFGYAPAGDVVHGISCQVSSGEILAIVGPNGSGKSTLLKIGGGLLVPRSGSVEVLGRNIAAYRRPELAKILAMVPQDGAISFPFSVEEIVLMGRAPHGIGKAFEREEDRAIASKAMDLADVAHLARQPVTRLSGGERQRVLIARALAQEPRILLLDEPNAHLDISHQVEIFNLLRAMNRDEGLTVVAISHDLNLAASYAHRMVVMSEGRIHAAGDPARVLTPETIRAVFETEVLVDAHPFHRTPRLTLLGTAGPQVSIDMQTTGRGE